MDEESRRAFLRDLKSRLRMEVAKCGLSAVEETRDREQRRQLAAQQAHEQEVQQPQPQPQLQSMQDLQGVATRAPSSAAAPASVSPAAPARLMPPPLQLQRLLPPASVVVRAAAAHLQHVPPAFAGAKRSREQAAGSGSAVDTGPAVACTIDDGGSRSEEAAEVDVEVEAGVEAEAEVEVEADHTVVAQRRRSHASSPLRHPEPPPISLRPLNPISPTQQGAAAAGAPPHDIAAASPPLALSLSATCGPTAEQLVQVTVEAAATVEVATSEEAAASTLVALAGPEHEAQLMAQEGGE